MDASEPFSPHRLSSKHTLALRQAEDGNLNLNQSLMVPGKPQGNGQTAPISGPPR